jgi:hypothetical protein
MEPTPSKLIWVALLLSIFLTPLRLFASAEGLKNIKSSCVQLLESMPTEVSNALIADEVFRSQYTNHGVVYHGTRNSWALNIVTTQDVLWPQSVGFNVSKDYQWPAEFAFGQQGVMGIVIPVRFHFDHIRVVDLAKIDLDRLVQLSEEKLNSNRGTYSELIHEAFGIDVLIVAGDRHPIIINKKVLVIPKDATELATDLARRIQNWKQDDFSHIRRDRVWDAYQNYYNLLPASAQLSAPRPDTIIPPGYQKMSIFGAHDFD